MKSKQAVDMHVRCILDFVRLVGSKWIPSGEEGRRRPGHCVHCFGQCFGATIQCEARVFDESIKR
jgi:hypothetical protein